MSENAHFRNEAVMGYVKKHHLNHDEKFVLFRVIFQYILIVEEIDTEEEFIDSTKVPSKVTIAYNEWVADLQSS